MDIYSLKESSTELPFGSPLLERLDLHPKRDFLLTHRVIPLFEVAIFNLVLFPKSEFPRTHCVGPLCFKRLCSA